MGVLSIAKINGADGKTGRYYTASVASGIEDYYAGKGEANGRWVGSGAGLFELGGEIDHEQFHRMLNGIDPRSGSPIRIAKRDPATGELAEGVVRGFDLTFSAPKSVSVLYAAGDDRVAGEVRAAVDRATEEALRWLEERACVVRRGAGGAAELPGHGFVGAAFRHRTSRAGDPQLHTHVVISNVARGDDGRWTALDAKHVYAHSRTAGFVFQVVMRDELTRRLGVRWRESPTPGVYEVEGVPFELMRALSKRREEIEHALAEVGMSGATAAQVATLATRPAKDHALDQAPGLHDGWRGICGEHGFGRQEVAAVIDHERADGKLVLVGDEHQLPEIDAAAASARSPNGWTRSSCVTTSASRTRTSATVRSRCATARSGRGCTPASAPAASSSAPTLNRPASSCSPTGSRTGRSAGRGRR